MRSSIVAATACSVGVVFKGQLFVRDPDRTYPNGHISSSYVAHASLPAAASDTGYHKGDWRVWRDPAQPAALYLVHGEGVERLPEADENFGCA